MDLLLTLVSLEVLPASGTPIPLKPELAAPQAKTRRLYSNALCMMLPAAQPLPKAVWRRIVHSKVNPQDWSKLTTSSGARDTGLGWLAARVPAKPLATRGVEGAVAGPSVVDDRVSPRRKKCCKRLLPGPGAVSMLKRQDYQKVKSAASASLVQYSMCASSEVIKTHSLRDHR